MGSRNHGEFPGTSGSPSSATPIPRLTFSSVPLFLVDRTMECPWGRAIVWTGPTFPSQEAGKSSR